MNATTEDPQQQSLNFLFLNVGHFFDHFFMLIFATAAVVSLTGDWDMSYAELIPYATPGFVAFGIGAIAAGWIADKWSRTAMMVVFFIGMGAASILCSTVSTPIGMSIGLLVMGLFGAIYHPVGLSLVVQGRAKTGMPLAINGIWGNVGVGAAALVTGFLVDNGGWRLAFIIPGVISIAIGIAYFFFLKKHDAFTNEKAGTKSAGAGAAAMDTTTLRRIFAIVIITTAIGGLVFQSSTFSLPKVFDERLGSDLAGSATTIGWWAFLVFSLAAIGQVIVGWLIDRYSIRTVFAIVAMVQCILFVVMMPLSGTMALIVSIGFMLAVFGQIPINDVLVGRIAKSEWRSRMFAARYIVTFSVSAAAVPIIAWLHATRGFSSLFAVMAVAAGIIFVMTLLLPSRASAVAST